MPEYMPHLSRIRATTEPAPAPTLISTEFAAFIQKELNSIDARIEQQYAQFTAELNREREARVKDVTELYALREQANAPQTTDEPEMILAQTPTRSGPPASAEIVTSPECASASCSRRAKATPSTKQEELAPELPIAALAEVKQAPSMNPASPTSASAADRWPASAHEHSTDGIRCITSSPRLCSVAPSQKIPSPERLCLTAPDDMKKLDRTAKEAEQLASSIARPPEVVGTEQGRLTSVAAVRMQALDGAASEADKLVCSSDKSLGVVSAEQARLTPVVAVNVKALDGTACETDKVVCCSSAQSLGAEQGRLTTVAAGSVKKLQGNEADEVACSISRSPEVVSTDQGRLTTVAADDIRKLDGARSEAGDVVCSRAGLQNDLSSEQGRFMTIAAGAVEKLDDAGSVAEREVCSVPQSQEILSTEQCRFTTNVGDDIERLDDTRLRSGSEACPDVRSQDYLCREQSAATVESESMQDEHGGQNEADYATDEHPSTLEYFNEPCREQSAATIESESMQADHGGQNEADYATDEHPSTLEYFNEPCREQSAATVESESMQDEHGGQNEADYATDEHPSTLEYFNEPCREQSAATIESESMQADHGGQNEADCATDEHPSTLDYFNEPAEACFVVRTQESFCTEQGPATTEFENMQSQHGARHKADYATDEHPSASECSNEPALKCSAAIQSARDESTLTTGITFKVYCDSTNMGYHVRLVGSSQSLGKWRLRQGLPLTTSKAEFPWWRLEHPVSISAGEVIEYKYVICENASGNTYEWEPRANRTLKFGIQTVVKDYFGSHDDCDWAHLAQELPARLSSRQYYSGMPREDSCSLLCPVSPLISKMQEPGFAEDFQSCYELLGSGPLGEGAFAQVWRCRSKAACSGPDVEVPEHAAKIVRTGQLADRDRHYILGEDGEIALHSGLNHPHIVQLHKHFNEGCSLTLVLEYCCGGDLFDAIVTAGGLSETASARMLRHLLVALCYLHDCLITHRDIKCENILLQHAQTIPERNIFKLCDFGLAARIKDDGLRDKVGSPDTVAPEVLRGEAYGSLVDIWSAGAVTYMALVASSPFAAPTVAQTLKRVTAASFSMSGAAWKDISDSAKDCVKEFMDPDTRTRPDAQRALENDWFDEFAKD
eukprot:TRINITY_DN2001_c0_g1_i3.p1 TRINITY_DN2001_c0_g1~~TRINITY_DN2001_c0_g1_i3.p1  ORF type:complete len:1158 (+),score=192.84 TRINITY_DN2001_c0_g1_i3:80-3475(+)